MRNVLRSALFTLLAWLACMPLLAHAGVADAPGDQLDVALITYGPGDTYWERFGHDAIQLRDRTSGEAVNFNYGVFDFDERGFLLHFARGQMHYRMDAAYAAQDESYYRDVGRSVTAQPLALTPTQAAQLRDFLLWNLRPENARYDYDYFTDNCATRVRDALDRALGGALRQQLATRPGHLTYRQQTDRLMAAQPWLMVAMDLGLGPYADRPLSAWQESFLPMVLSRELASVQVADANGRPLAIAGPSQVISPNRVTAPPERAPDLRLPLAATGLIVAIALIATARRWPTGHALLGTLYLVAAGIVGLVLLALWTLTTHHSAWANANLLLFNPLAFALLPALWRARRGVAPGRGINALIMLQLAACLVAILLHLLPGVVQQNQPWLLFALPVWLALAFTLRGRRRASV